MADLTNAALSGLKLTGIELPSANLTEADLSGAKLTGANLTDATLARAQLDDADLRWANLNRASLNWGSLRGTELVATDLTGAVLHQAGLSRAVIGNTRFIAVDLSGVRGLERTWHLEPSIISIDTIYRSKGNIPETFLRGAGVPEDFIVYMRSIAGHPIEFYSCFISYSTKDEDFARRLHADMQQANVRCWFAPEDLNIGDKFRTRIDESIRLYDKLLVVLSENSIVSAWVEDEVEAALEKERKTAKLVLFPIRLDDAVRETDQAWAASLRRTCHIGDFRNWKDHEAFKKAFERLLLDLKSSDK